MGLGNASVEPARSRCVANKQPNLAVNQFPFRQSINGLLHPTHEPKYLTSPYESRSYEPSLGRRKLHQDCRIKKNGRLRELSVLYGSKDKLSASMIIYQMIYFTFLLNFQRVRSLKLL